MATVVETRTKTALRPEERFVLPGIGWEGYESLLELVAEGRMRFTFDGIDVEFVSPRIDHEGCATLIGQIVKTVNEELKIPFPTVSMYQLAKAIQERGLRLTSASTSPIFAPYKANGTPSISTSIPLPTLPSRSRSTAARWVTWDIMQGSAFLKSGDPTVRS